MTTTFWLGRAGERNSVPRPAVTSSAVSTQILGRSLAFLPDSSRRVGSARMTAPSNASPVIRYSAITSGSS